MQIIGLASVVLFLASLALFVSGFINPNFAQTGMILGAVFLIAAAVVLGVTIKKRNKTERI